MNEPLDLLQIKIEEAKSKLPEATRKAIDTVNWRAIILTMRLKKGYSFEQLESLEIETELMLCGLSKPEDYPKKLETEMKISKEEAELLVQDMNLQVFTRIREELIKNIERNKIKSDKPASFLSQEELPPAVVSSGIKKDEAQILNKAGIQLVSVPPTIVTPRPVEQKSVPTADKTTVAPVPEVHPLLEQKLTGAFQVPGTKTEYSLNNISKTNKTDTESVKTTPKVDPYREMPE